MIFVILMLIIGIITTALVSVIHKNCEVARKDTPILLTMSVLIMVVSGGYLGYSVYNHHISTGIKSKFSFGG
jgi:UDP-N-acetylmuramyl pentapeptide phosphotransferase/UDP-N-acetylglucosamine-1-phosphate transferase